MKPPPPQQYEATDAATKPETTTAERYRPERERTGNALCLSGGGFRATLFHLGALRRLNETGVLAKLDTISSVSGGSIMAAMLATRAPWPVTAPIPADVWERDVAAPTRRFVTQNLRTPAMIGRLLQPWNTSAGVRGLLAGYRKHLSSAKLASLPERPRFVFCATDLCYGVNFVFERARVGDYRLGYLSPPPTDWEVARAVAASSCFPPIFNPLPLDLPVDALQAWPRAARRRRRPPERRRPLRQPGAGTGLEGPPHRAGLRRWRGVRQRHRRRPAVAHRPLRRHRRPPGAGAAQALAHLQFPRRRDGRRVLGHRQRHRQLPGGRPRLLEGARGASDRGVRTDLDAFSPAEMAVLENHGYALAAAAVTTHLADLAAPDAPAAAPPHPEWTDEDRVRAALADSWKRKLLGRW